jgi:hypothetical protein
MRKRGLTAEQKQILDIFDVTEEEFWATDDGYAEASRLARIDRYLFRRRTRVLARTIQLALLARLHRGGVG